MKNAEVETGTETRGAESVRERTLSLQFEGLRVGAVLKGDCFEEVTVKRRESGPTPRTSTERKLVDYLRGRLRGHRPVRWDRLRLDDRTEFSRTVYAAASEVPAGATVSYGELARRIGKEGAAQAVGQALRVNPVPLVVPCHRVIREDGRAGGYAGKNDSDLKLYLLRLEERWSNRRG